MATKGEICLAHKECTCCPIRAMCSIRETFYSDSAYEKFIQDTMRTSERVLKIYGFSESMIHTNLKAARDMMEHRREVELKLHPTYSPI